MNTILVAYDGSEHAASAVRMASDLAKRYDAELVVAHVVTEGPLPEELLHLVEVEHLADAELAERQMGVSGRPASISTEPEPRLDTAQARMAIARKVAEHGERLAQQAGATRTRIALESGDPASAILEAAERERAGMIVMGSRGLGSLKGLLLGSVSHKVAQLSSRPLLTVRAASQP